MTSIAYWPGDLNPASFQTLAYSSITNTLTLTPFGNSVVLNPVQQNVSTMNASTINVISANLSTVNSFIQNTTTLNSQTVATSTVNATTINNTTINNQTVNTSTINTVTNNNTTVNSQTINTSTINTSNINISSINGEPLYNSPVVNYVDPYGTSPIVSTLGGSSVAIGILTFSTIANHAYHVSVEYSATNNGGGGANDATSLGITNSNSSVGLFGRYIALDSWVTLDTYTVRRANVTGIFNANSNNSGAAVFEVLNESVAGNSQIVTIEQFAVKDLGIPVNNF